MSDINQHVSYLSSDEELIISKRIKTRVRIPMFQMVGKKSKVNGHLSSVPLIELMLEFNKEEQWFYKLLWERMDVISNECDLSKLEWTATDNNRKSRAYTSLKEKNLVKRIGKGVYMINPNAAIHPKGFELAKRKWDSF
jgi:hypothetical protein